MNHIRSCTHLSLTSAVFLSLLASGLSGCARAYGEQRDAQTRRDVSSRRDHIGTPDVPHPTADVHLNADVAPLATTSATVANPICDQPATEPAAGSGEWAYVLVIGYADVRLSASHSQPRPAVYYGITPGHFEYGAVAAGPCYAVRASVDQPTLYVQADFRPDYSLPPTTVFSVDLRRRSTRETPTLIGMQPSLPLTISMRGPEIGYPDAVRVRLLPRPQQYAYLQAMFDRTANERTPGLRETALLESLRSLGVDQTEVARSPTGNGVGSLNDARLLIQSRFSGPVRPTAIPQRGPGPSNVATPP